MRIYPSLEVKPVDQLKPGDLVINRLNGDPCLAIFTVYTQASEGDKLPMLVYLPTPPGKPDTPFLRVVNHGSFLYLGRDYAVVVDPLRQPASSAPPSKVQMLVSKAERLLCVWTSDGRFQIAVNLDTGVGQQVPDDYNAVEFSAWEIRLLVNDKIDWTRDPLYRWSGPT